MTSADARPEELSFMERWWREQRPSSVGSPAASNVLRGVLVYEDKATRQWAVETWDEVGMLVGKGNVETSSWQTGQLSQPQALSEAVAKSATADVVVVALRAAPDLSSSGMAGASREVEEYLRAVARRARMEFTARQRQLDLELDAAYGEDLARRATLVTPLLGQILDQGPSPYQHWGINE
jgi:hypothetical protein